MFAAGQKKVLLGIFRQEAAKGKFELASAELWDHPMMARDDGLRLIWPKKMGALGFNRTLLSMVRDNTLLFRPGIVELHHPVTKEVNGYAMEGYFRLNSLGEAQKKKKKEDASNSVPVGELAPGAAG